MDDDSDDVMAPMVDALTGAMSAILLVSIFMMISTISTVSESIKQYGKEALYKNEMILGDIFKREPPILDIEKNILFFFKSFKLTSEQKEKLTLLFSNSAPSKLTIYSNDKDDIKTYNTLLFLKEVGLNEKIDSIELIFLPAKEKEITEFTWELK